MARRLHVNVVAFLAFLAIGVASPAQATSVSFAAVGVGISGPGAIAAGYGFPQFSICTPGLYTFGGNLRNLTGSGGITSSSFFDVFVDIEIDNVRTPCGSVNTLDPGATLVCQITQLLSKGLHTLTSWLTITLPDPLPLGATDLPVRRVVANGPEVTVNLLGMEVEASNVAVLGGVAVAAGATAGVAVPVSGLSEDHVVPESGTLVLISLGLAVSLMVVRRSQSGSRHPIG